MSDKELDLYKLFQKGIDICGSQLNNTIRNTTYLVTPRIKNVFEKKTGKKLRGDTLTKEDEILLMCLGTQII